MKDHPASIGVTYGQHVGYPAVVEFLNRENRYKSVATQISHDAVRFIPRDYLDEIELFNIFQSGNVILYYADVT